MCDLLEIDSIHINASMFWQFLLTNLNILDFFFRCEFNLHAIMLWMFQLAKEKTSNQFDDNVFIHIIIQNHNVMIFQFICLCIFLYFLEHFNQYLQRKLRTRMRILYELQLQLQYQANHYRKPTYSHCKLYLHWRWWWWKWRNSLWLRLIRAIQNRSILCETRCENTQPQH